MSDLHCTCQDKFCPLSKKKSPRLPVSCNFGFVLNAVIIADNSTETLFQQTASALS